MAEADIFHRRRTIRRFEPKPVPKEAIEWLIDCARLAPSAANLQPLRFIATVDDKVIGSALPFLRWAGYVRPRRDPVPGAYPKAMVVVCHDREVSDSHFLCYDVGSAVQTILLAGVSRGLGGCWIGAIEEAGLRDVFKVSENWKIHCVVALGYPAEDPVVEEAKGGEIRYFLDDSDRLHVPKRPLSEVLRWM